MGVPLKYALYSLCHEPCPLMRGGPQGAPLFRATVSVGKREAGLSSTALVSSSLAADTQFGTKACTFI